MDNTPGMGMSQGPQDLQQYRLHFAPVLWGARVAQCATGQVLHHEIGAAGLETTSRQLFRVLCDLPVVEDHDDSGMAQASYSSNLIPKSSDESTVTNLVTCNHLDGHRKVLTCVAP